MIFNDNSDGWKFGLIFFLHIITIDTFKRFIFLEYLKKMYL